jgi:tricarballylate dehydrogenase
MAELNEQFDVVVVGCGVAGLSAAVAAAESGAHVAVLERSTFDERGGNTRYTTAAIRMQSEDAVSADFEQCFASNSGYHVPPDIVESTALDYENWPALTRTAALTGPDLIGFFSEQAAPTIAWLRSHGVRFGGIGFYGLTARSSPRIAISGGGLHLIQVMTEQALALGARFFYETTAHDLITDIEGSVTGIVARTPGKQAMRIRAAAVVLACGGFEGNPEMVARYVGPKGRYLRPVARGGYYNKGEGIAMALRLGAAPAGDFAEFHAQPIDPRSSATEPIVMLFPYGILVNRAGRRFVNESPGPIDASYEDIARTIADQKDGIAFCILDRRIEAIENWQRCVRSDVPPQRAETLGELGAQLGFDGTEAQRSLGEYNASCPRDGRFNPFVLDGLSTSALYPPKSNLRRAFGRAAVPRLSDHRLQHVHVRGTEGRCARAGARPRRQPDAGPLCSGGNRRPVLRAISGCDFGPAWCRLRPARRDERGAVPPGGRQRQSAVTGIAAGIDIVIRLRMAQRGDVHDHEAHGGRDRHGHRHTRPGLHQSGSAGLAGRALA